MTLPIDEVIPELRAVLSAHRAAVLQAPPGAGKTTRIPLELLEETWLRGRSILMLEPRRLAARAAASRMAQLRAEPVGRTVGYRIRFESKVSAQTRVEVLTEGILTRRLQGDPELVGVGLVIFDEFHERHLHADLALALTLDSQRALREDLRILVMSATLDGVAVSRLLGGAPIITSTGRSFPVSISFSQRDPVGPLPPVVAEAVNRAVCEHQGDVLVFLPGAKEIRRTQALLAQSDTQRKLDILPLYGDLPWEQQDRAIRPDGEHDRRRVVLATPIAETSLTIEGVRVVIDAGYVRVPQLDAKSGLSRLITQRISRASSEQRAGRAGRTAPGVCYRLWSENTQRGLIPQAIPEIRGADLAPLALELAAWGVRDVASLSWLDSPPPAALAQAQELLRQLDAVDVDGRITGAGREMVQLPLHPRLGHMLRVGAKMRHVALACDLAALVSERDILIGEARRSCDIELRLDALRQYRRLGHNAVQDRLVDANACARVDQAARQYRRLVVAAEEDDVTGRQDVGRLLALAYPDRIAMQRSGNEPRYLLANGRGTRLPPWEMRLRHPLLAVASADADAPERGGTASSSAAGGAGGGEGFIYLAAPLAMADLEELFANRLQTTDVVRWDVQQEAVIARRERRLGALLLDSTPLAHASAEKMRSAMLDGVSRLGLKALPWDDAARQWQARVLCMRAWFPQENWPDVSDAELVASLDDWLGPYLDGITRRDHLARLDLGQALKAQLDWNQTKQLDQDAPTHLEVPSGSRLRLEYAPGASPVLAVKLQEMFGLADTPRVARGHVAVTLHLLSPARRPIQVTQDLRGFWDRTYAEVKKELKGRYPKHPWPEDPWNADPTARRARKR